jgi:cytochrome P450
LRAVLQECVLVRGPAALKRVFQTRQRTYGKDTGFTYHPFMSILGSGLVTSDGQLWQQQRLLIGPALRMDILDKVVGVAKAATDRLSDKLMRMRGTGKAVNMEEEFRHLALQV